jgi:MtN3 and saliva related transmembrane protein
MSTAEWLGLLAGALTTSSTIPQLMRVLKLKSAHEISLLFTTMLLLGMCCWLVYGIWLGLVSVIVWNAIGAASISVLLWAKLKYGR